MVGDKKQNTKRLDLSRLLVGLGLLMCLNYLGSFVFLRFDLTSEKRYTLTNATLEMLEQLEDVVYVKVYLEGEFPADFTRLQKSVKEMLDELRSYNKLIEFEFIDPTESNDKKTMNEIFQQLKEKGLQYTNIPIDEGGNIGEMIVFPGAIVTYRDREVPLQILKSENRFADAQMINNSINNFEYEFANTLRKLVQNERPSVAFLEGNGELKKIEIEDFENALKEFYSVERISLEHKLDALDDFDCIVIAKPTIPYDDRDKFIIDQFIMRGGKALWMIDPILASMDSLQGRSETVGISYDINIKDMLFTYGVRINDNLLLQQLCAPIALTTGFFGNQPKVEMFPWFFYPLIVPQSSHPIVSNLDPIKLEFCSSLDSVGRDSIIRTVLLSTSEKSKELKPPVRINLGMAGIKHDFTRNNKPNLPVAMMLEGKFNSVFKNRISSAYTDSASRKVLDRSAETKMIVIGDGDVARNPVNKEKQIFYTLGFDRAAGRKIYGNREFLLNAMNYLLNDASLITVRSREIKLRTLDQDKVSGGRLFWQFSNVVFPILLVILFGIIQYVVRKRKYGVTA